MTPASSQREDHRQGPRLLGTRDEIREAGIVIAQQARREILLFGRTLETDLYDADAFVEAVRRLALARPELPVRILLSDPQTSAKVGHRLIRLAQRLTSRVAIRRLADDFLNRSDAFLVCDERGYVRRVLAESKEGVADVDGRREARRLRGEFMEMWEHSECDLELRRLDL